MPLRFIDLFAGLGGFHSALRKMGHECVFASELRSDLKKLYAINYPGTRIEGDITKIKPEDIPNHDILCAGFPCRRPVPPTGQAHGLVDDHRPQSGDDAVAQPRQNRADAAGGLA